MTNVEKAAQSAVNNVWFTALARVSSVILMTIMVPSGAWLISTVMELRDRQLVTEQWRLASEARSGTNMMRIEALQAKTGDIEAARREQAEQMRSIHRETGAMAASLARIESRLDAVINGQGQGQRQ